VVAGDKTCAKWIFGNTVLLIASTLLPVFFGLLGVIYAVISLGFGVRFLWLNWLLVKDPSHALARKNFLFSMQYLAGVFLAIVIDRHVPLSTFRL
jgi:protoheme IX farnesyltransferase